MTDQRPAISLVVRESPHARCCCKRIIVVEKPKHSKRVDWTGPERVLKEAGRVGTKSWRD